MNIYSDSPVAQDGFTRLMADSYFQRQKITRNLAFQSFFGVPETGAQSLFTADALAVDIEIMKDDSVIAALHTRGESFPLGTDVSQGQKASYTSRVFPISKGVGKITSQDVSSRAFGEQSIGSGMSKYDRFRMIAAMTFTSKIQSQLWLFEQLAAESILYGKMKTDENGGEFDFRRNPNNSVSAANPWTDEVNGTPFKDIDSLCVLVDENGDAQPDFVGMDSESFDALIKFPDAEKVADNRRYDIFWVGESDKRKPDSKYARHIKGGWQPRAYLVTETGYGVWIFTYNGSYRKETSPGVKTKVKYLPKGTVFATSTDARFDRYFGPHDKMPEQLSTNSVLIESFGISPDVAGDISTLGSDSPVDPRQFHFFAYGNQDNSGVSLEVQTAPIFASTQVDAVATMDNVVL